MSEKGVDVPDAPISGGEEGAIEGTLSIMVGGHATVLKRHQDLLNILGESIIYCGDTGTGQITKACNQIVVGVTFEAVSVDPILAQRAGTNIEAVVDAISGGAAGCLTNAPLE